MRACACITCNNRPYPLCHEPHDVPPDKAQKKPHGSFEVICGGREHVCFINSLLSTCRNHDVNPRESLNDIISRMPYMEKASHEQLVELLPHKWKLIPHEPAVTLPTDGKPFVTEVYR